MTVSAKCRIQLDKMIDKNTHLTEESDKSETQRTQYACKRIPYDIIVGHDTSIFSCRVTLTDLSRCLKTSRPGAHGEQMSMWSARPCSSQ